MAVTNCVVGMTDSGKRYEGRYSTSDDFLRGCRTVKGLNGSFKYMMGVSRQDASAALLVIEPRNNQCVKAYSFKDFPTNVDSNVVLHKAVALFERDNPRFHACSELAEEIESRYDKAFNAFKDLYYSFGMKDSDIRGFEAGDKNPDEMFNRVAYGKNLYSMTSDQMEAYLYDSIAELGDVQCISDDEICKYCPSVNDYLSKDDDFTVKTAYSPAKSNPLHNSRNNKKNIQEVKSMDNKQFNEDFVGKFNSALQEYLKKEVNEKGAICLPFIHYDDLYDEEHGTLPDSWENVDHTHFDVRVDGKMYHGILAQVRKFNVCVPMGEADGTHTLTDERPDEIWTEIGLENEKERNYYTNIWIDDAGKNGEYVNIELTEDTIDLLNNLYVSRKIFTGEDPKEFYNDDFTAETAYRPARNNPSHNGIADKPVKEQVKYFPNASVVEIHNVSAKLLGNTSVDDIKTFSVPGSSKGAFTKFIVPATFITPGEKPSRFDITMPDGWMLTSADKQGTSYSASQVKEMYQTALSEYATKKRQGKSKQVSTVGRRLPSCSDVSSEPDDEYNNDIDM